MFTFLNEKSNVRTLYIYNLCNRYLSRILSFRLTLSGRRILCNRILSSLLTLCGGQNGMTALLRAALISKHRFEMLRDEAKSYLDGEQLLTFEHAQNNVRTLCNRNAYHEYYLLYFLYVAEAFYAIEVYL